MKRVNDDTMEWARTICSFRTAETTVFDRHFYDAHPVEWGMAELNSRTVSTSF